MVSKIEIKEGFNGAEKWKDSTPIASHENTTCIKSIPCIETLKKNYLRNSMGQERLITLALFSIESDTSVEMDFNAVIKDFVHSKTRKLIM